MMNEWCSMILSILTGLITSAFVSLIFLNFQCKLNDFKELFRCTLSYTYFNELKEHPEYDDGTYGYILGFLKNNVDELGVILTGGVCNDIKPIAICHIEYLKSVVKEVNKQKRADAAIIESLETYSSIIEKYQNYKKNIIKFSIRDAIFSKVGICLISVLIILFIIA